MLLRNWIFVCTGVFLFLYSFLFVAVSTAQEPLFKNPIRYNSFSELLTSILNGVTTILIPIVTLALVVIGFQMVLAGASQPEKFAKLKQSFFWALVGLFIVLGAKGILSVIETTLQDVLREDTAQVLSSQQVV